MVDAYWKDLVSTGIPMIKRSGTTCSPSRCSTVSPTVRWRITKELLDRPNYQGNAAVNYTDRETPWTRIIEHKWFEFGKDEAGNDLPRTVISREYSSEWKPGDEPYYPVNDERNSKLYASYKALADKEEKVIFGGRLGEYKYYDMDQVIAAALERAEGLG